MVFQALQSGHKRLQIEYSNRPIRDADSKKILTSSLWTTKGCYVQHWEK
jgi:hypothetical protein